MPIGVFVQEANNLFHWCKDDRQALIRAGLDWPLVTSLPVRSGACCEAQSLWMKEWNTNHQFEKSWKEQAPGAFELRDQLVHDFRFAFRKHDDLVTTVDQIAKGDTSSDMVQDLSDLAVLGKAHADLLAVIHFNLTTLDTAADLSGRMGDLLGAANNERNKDSEVLLIRNQAFTYLKYAVDEIRECGKFAFRSNPDKLKGYFSQHWQKANSGRGKSPDQE